MNAMNNTKKCEICGRELPLSDFSKSYRNRCRECVAKMTRVKRAKAKQDADKSILTISPEAFDKALWQTETGFDEQAYNNWLKKSAAVMKKTYEKIEGIVETGELYLLGDVINLLDSITIKVRKGGAR